MNYIKPVIVFLFHVLALGLAHASDLELANPGFELHLANWTPGDNDRGRSTVLAEGAHSGKYGLVTDDQSSKTGSFLRSDPVPVTPGDKLVLSFYARNLSGHGMGVYLSFYDKAGKKIDEFVKGVPREQKEWKQLKHEATVPEDAVEVCVILHSSNKGRVVAHVDDFVLTNQSAQQK